MSKPEQDDRMEEEGEDEEEDSSEDGSDSGPDGAGGGDEDADEELILLLEARLQTCGGRDYDAHAQLVRCLKDRGELKKLDKARLAFSEMFPLTEDMWLEWISDEGRLAVSDTEQAKVTTLYERAVADYSTPKLWESYMGHCQKRFKEREEGDPSKAKLLADARSVAERAVCMAGSHFTEGQRLWELQRAFELEILAAMKEDDGTLSRAKSDSAQSQASRVRTCYLNQLDTPGRGAQSAWHEYKAWEQDTGILEAAQKALSVHAAQADAREALEAKISAASAGDAAALVAAWQTLIAFEEKQAAPTGAAANLLFLQRTPSVVSRRERDRVCCRPFSSLSLSRFLVAFLSLRCRRHNPPRNTPVTLPNSVSIPIHNISTKNDHKT